MSKIDSTVTVLAGRDQYFCNACSAKVSGKKTLEQHVVSSYHLGKKVLFEKRQEKEQKEHVSTEIEGEQGIEQQISAISSEEDRKAAIKKLAELILYATNLSIK
jgi:Na+-translocating ferredoxin:NAD+ oxidoreductase RnfC subunit